MASNQSPTVSPAPTLAPTSAAPTKTPPKNLAKGKPTKQSSNYSSSMGLSKNAVDGNTNGNWSSGSVTHTGANRQAWWEVDLEKVFSIDTIMVYNRADCCSTRLSNFNVIITHNGKETWNQNHPGSAKQKTTFAVPKNVKGDKVKVQLQGSNYLSLAEVEVFGESTTVKKCSTNGKKCLSVEKLSFDSSEDDLLKVKFDFRPMMKWQKDTKQVVVVKGGEKPNNTNTYASKNVRRRKQTLLFDLASLVSKMPDGVGSLDIYFVKGGTVVYPETMISINVVSGPPPTSSPTMSPETKLGDVTAKDISLNSKPGREIQLKKGSGNVNVNLSAQISGRCGNGCPSCVKAVKLALFNPLNKRIKDKCHSQHSGSQCSFKAFNENYSIDTNLAGKWEVRVEGRWAWCSDGLDNFGTLVNIVVE